MKARLYILFILLVIGWSSCTRHTTYPLFMQEAAMCMNEHPDHALELLQHQKDSIASFPEETQMYYHLLCIQARDKQYIEHTSDSLINQIVQYYENHDDAEKLMMAYYYQGSTYRDMNDAPRALKAFQQAVDVSKHDNILLPKAYNQMGSLFMYQGLYDEAIRVNRKNIELYTKLGQPNKAAYALRDIARMYSMKGEIDSSIFYYKEAYNTALANRDSICYYAILGEYGGFNYQIGDIQTAKKLLLIAEKNLHRKSKYNIYLNLGSIYKNDCLWDSAYYYYHKTLHEGDIYSKYYAYQDLSQMESLKGDQTKALKYLRLHVTLKDSIEKVTQTEAIAKINSLYNYQHTEKENAQLKLDKERQKSWTLVLAFVALLACSLCLFVVLYQRQKKAKAILEQKKRDQLEAERYANSQAAIQDNNRRIAELNSLLKDSITENDILKQELLKTQRKRLEIQNEEIIQYQKEHKLLLAEFKSSELYKEIWIASNNEDTNLALTKFPEKWVAIQDNIDRIYPDFTQRIKGFYPFLSDTELQVCWLTKIGISPSGIARVLNLSKQAITNIRSRLTQKMKIKESKWANFDHFIEEM
ncbi:MAG: tetratricopeptide repeat protein [Bacteroidaceae bacterium]|nr:tetratricopeptide repeat protein [Bacteroidaceae bacterium]